MGCCTCLILRSSSRMHWYLPDRSQLHCYVTRTAYQNKQAAPPLCANMTLCSRGMLYMFASSFFTPNALVPARLVTVAVGRVTRTAHQKEQAAHQNEQAAPLQGRSMHELRTCLPALVFAATLLLYICGFSPKQGLGYTMYPKPWGFNPICRLPLLVLTEPFC